MFVFVEITLVECDKYTKDDGLETKTFDVSGLELNKSYPHTFTFDEAFQVSVFLSYFPSYLKENLAPCLRINFKR